MPRILLPIELIAKLLAVFKWRIMHGFMDLAKGKKVVPDVGRQHRSASFIFRVDL